MKQVEIKLLCRDFTVACPEEEEANLQKSINYLANKIDEVQKSGNIIGVDKTIIMAALNITHEFLNHDVTSSVHIVDYKKKITNLNTLVNQAMES